MTKKDIKAVLAAVNKFGNDIDKIYDELKQKNSKCIIKSECKESDALFMLRDQNDKEYWFKTEDLVDEYWHKLNYYENKNKKNGKTILFDYCAKCENGDWVALISI